MALSREKRTQRKKSRIHRLINRACRINIIRTLRNLLGDTASLPVSRTSERAEHLSADDFSVHFPIEEMDINVSKTISPAEDIETTPICIEKPIADEGAAIDSENLLPAFFDESEAVCESMEKEDTENISTFDLFHLTEQAYEEEEPLQAVPHEVEASEMSKKSGIENIIITPYGIFSKYEQESLLDQYGADERQEDGGREIVVTNAREVIHRVLEITAAVISSLFARLKGIMVIISRCVGNCLNLLGIKVTRLAQLLLARLPESFKSRMSRACIAATDGLLKGIGMLDRSIGHIDSRLNAVEDKAAETADRIGKRLRIQLRLLIAGSKKVVVRLSRIWQRTVDYADRNRRKCAFAASCLLVVITASSIFVGSISAYEYSYNGKVLGIVRNQNDVYATVDVIGDKLAKAYDANIVISKEENISFNRVYGLDLKIDNREDVLNSFTYLKDMEVMAAAITVDGKQVAVLDNSKNAQAILDAIQNKYIKKSDKVKYDKIGFAENVKITEVDTKLGDLQDREDIMEYMMTGAIEKKKHVVESGQTFSGIAAIYGIKQSQLRSSNPDVEPDKLQIGQELILTAAVPVVTVQTVETAEYTAAIPYEIKYENTEAKYKGEQSVKSKGVNGQKQVVAKIVRNNGLEVERTEISSTIIAEPVAQIVLVGTKKLPPLIGTGSFIKPVRGKITSRFGTRWGRMHEGVDYGASTGTSVSAADGGTVIYAGWDGAYGKVIRINHGGGKVTVYAHLSKIQVKKGTKVYKGQQIGNVGNTGRSTGPHLHFEIRVNGVPKNPLNYL